jgi:UDP-N-acetylmuramoyl-L-alanyl-D-glutamate--2,6-diaminopimelate ligase
METIKKLVPKPLKNFYHLVRAILANIVFGFPAKKLKIIGVTGTKGKTTTAWFIYQILKNADFKVGLIATTGGKIKDKDFNLGFHITTPDPPKLQKYLNTMVEQGIKWVVVEATSHGLAQHRLWGLKFDIGIFTNIASDHLDYHETWENYFKTKARLIKKFKSGGVAILNKDDKSYPLLVQIAQKQRKKTITFAIEDKTADFRGTPKDYSLDQVSFILRERKDKTTEATISLLGEFNILNGLAAIATAKVLGIKNQVIFESLKKITSPPGRMEIVQKDPFLVIVDFAHNPAALKTALESLAKFKITPNSKIIALFGCPGLRDKSRRKMGLVSAKLADITVITADDSRTERTEDIIEEIASWTKKGGAREIKAQDYQKEKHKRPIYIKIPDRKRAIAFATKIAEKNDVVGLFGMGHQRTICIGTTEYPWSERAVAQEALARKSKE